MGMNCRPSQDAVLVLHHGSGKVVEHLKSAESSNFAYSLLSNLSLCHNLVN
jgi:hypothetical protein